MADLLKTEVAIHVLKIDKDSVRLMIQFGDKTIERSYKTYDTQFLHLTLKGGL